MSVLFVTPVFPNPTGGGANMRAWLTLACLAKRHAVTMVVFCQNDNAQSGDLAPQAREHCRRVLIRTHRENGAPSSASWIRSLTPFWSRVFQAILPRPMECAWLPPTWVLDVGRELASEDFSSVHAYKLSMAAPALDLAQGCHSVLDLDDIESKAARRFAELDRPASGRLLYLLRRLESLKLKRFEASTARRFDRITVCSDPDQSEMKARVGDKVSVLPNCVAAPVRRRPPGLTHCRNILFVGSLDYAPNQDAVKWICGDIKAGIDRKCGANVSVRIVGRRPFAGAAAMASEAGVELVANAPDLADHYLWASAVIVPIRSGGGTRIKILEALAYGVPVISTTLGAEGLLLEDGRDYLKADSSEEFARAIQRLLDEPGLGERIAAAGLSTYEDRYAPAVAERVIASLHAT